MLLRFDSLGLSLKFCSLCQSLVSLDRTNSNFQTEQKRLTLASEMKGGLLSICWSTTSFMTNDPINICFSKLSSFKYDCNMIRSAIGVFLSLCVFVHACAFEAVMCLMIRPFHCESSPIPQSSTGWRCWHD